MKFTMASASYKDYTDELKEAGFKVEVVTEIVTRQFGEYIKTACEGISKTMIDIADIAELMKLKEHVKHDIVIADDGDYREIPQIIIYDGYLE